MNDKHTHTERNAHNYGQAMKTGKHEDKPQVLGQLLNIGNLLRRDYKKSFLLITLILKRQLTILVNTITNTRKWMCLLKS